MSLPVGHEAAQGTSCCVGKSAQRSTDQHIAGRSTDKLFMTRRIQQEHRLFFDTGWTQELGHTHGELDSQGLVLWGGCLLWFCSKP